MPSASTQINFKIDGLERIRKNLEQTKLVAKLGIFGDENKRDEDTKGNKEDKKAGLTNAELGASHEFGAPEISLPRRSFLLDPLTIKGKELTKKTEQIIDRYIDEENGIETILELVGIYGESVVQEAFETGGFGAWQPITEATSKRKKGNTEILKDTTQLSKSIISKVEKRNN